MTFQVMTYDVPGITVPILIKARKRTRFLMVLAKARSFAPVPPRRTKSGLWSEKRTRAKSYINALFATSPPGPGNISFLGTSRFDLY